VLWTLLSFLGLASMPLANTLSVGLIGGLLLTDSTILGGGTATAAAAPKNNPSLASGQISKEATATA
jgi:hypothetical protein